MLRFRDPQIQQMGKILKQEIKLEMCEIESAATELIVPLLFYYDRILKGFSERKEKIAECGSRIAGFYSLSSLVLSAQSEINNEELKFKARNPKSEIRNCLTL